VPFEPHRPSFGGPALACWSISAYFPATYLAGTYYVPDLARVDPSAWGRDFCFRVKAEDFDVSQGGAQAGRWQTASMLLPSGSRT